MKMFLIDFEYDHYCQGYENARDTMLVFAYTYEQAKGMIGDKYRNARSFVNKTVSWGRRLLRLVRYPQTH